MSKYNFLYRDTSADSSEVSEYLVGDVFLEPSGLKASFLRGGMLSGCNIRVLITLEIGYTLTWADTDFTNRGIFVFSSSRNFWILDVYKIGEYYQILITPNVLEDEIKTEVVRAARQDFMEIFNSPPVQVLNTPEWKAHVKYLMGSNRKKLSHHRAQTD